jgi:hypothetical protein
LSSSTIVEEFSTWAPIRCNPAKIGVYALHPDGETVEVLHGGAPRSWDATCAPARAST